MFDIDVMTEEEKMLVVESQKDQLSSCEFAAFKQDALS